MTATGLLERMRLRSMERCEAARGRLSSSDLRRALAEVPPPKSLRLSQSGFDLIAEVKRRSPSEGALDIASTTSLEHRVDAYTRAGAVAISVLTEPTEFNGSLKDLATASRLTDVPTMRKDFLVDPYQVLEARAAGASGVLLIVRMLSDRELEDLLGMCASLDMFALVEAFDRQDLERAERVLRLAPVSPWFAGDSDPALGLPGYVPCLVGINARDLTSLRVDATRFGELKDRFPPGFPRVAESGLSTPNDAAAVAAMGYRLALVGSALMKSADPADLIRGMLREARREGTRQKHAG